MKKNVKEKKRILSLILAVVMVVTMMPMQAVAAATDSTAETTVEKNDGQTEKAQQPAKTGDEKDGENPAVSVKWLPNTGEREDESKGEVQLEASLNKNGSAASADVEIRLDKEEADALAQFRNEEGKLDEAVKLTEEELPEISLKKQDNGEVRLCFTLDQENTALKQKIEFQVPENAEKDVEIEVTKEDVTVAPEQKNDAQNGGEAEQVAFEFEGKVLSLSVPEKAAQDNEKNTPNDEENNDKEQNAPVDEENNLEDDSKQPSADGQEPAKEKKQLKMDGLFAAVRSMALSDLAGYETKTPSDLTTITQNIIWADNNNENNARPTIDEFKNQYTLSYHMKETKTGDVLQGVLAEEDTTALSVFKLESFPAAITKSGANRYKLEIKDLPTKMTYTDEYGDSVTYEIEWTIVPKNVAGYSLVNVTEDTLDKWEGLSSITELGWYYMLNTDFSFNVVLRQGGKNGTDEIAQAVKDHFQMEISCEGKDLTGTDELMKTPTLSFNGSPTGVMTYQNVWKYNLDGARITYDVVEREGVTEDKIVVESLDPTVTGDYFALTYDNSNSANYGSVTNKIHENGTLYLTLTGKTEYEATKVWLDQGVEEKNRPTGEFQLWRYREGESYTTAAPVRDDKGDFYTCDLDTGKDSFPVKFDIEVNVQKELGLEKYDPEGYRYFYVSREYLNSINEDGKPADNYEQVFGAVNEEGTKVTDRIEDKDITKDEPYSRDNANTFLYDGGTLSNRITENVTVAGEKEWKAAAFQADFEDVTVVMTVQSRPKNSEDAWKNTNQSVTLDKFYAENLGSVTFSKSMPKYNSLGEELEYRWAETAVYQGENTKNLLEDKAGEDGEQYFTLKQNEEDVRYRSDSKTEGTNTVITNTIANTVRYDVKKIWKNADGEETDAPEGAEVTFGIYRSLNGEVTAQPVVEVTLDGVADEEPITVTDKDLGIDLTVQETSPWFATVNPLNEYDKEGHQYEYLLLETKNNTNFVPTYETIRGKDGKGKFYKTTVTNAPGKGNRILVSKEWTDDSDIIHRQPVKIGVYVKEEVTIGDRTYAANEKIAETELNEGNVWFDWVGIGEIEPDNVYILETKVGNANVPLSEENPNVPQAPIEYDEKGYTAIQYDTENHKYEATYFKKTLGRETVYTVNNRRLGNVDLTVTKDWKDGNGAKRDALEKALEKSGLTLAVQLQFADHSNGDGYQITNNGLNKPDTISVAKNGHPVAIKDNSGENASSLQSVPFGNDAKIYFYNLPKYDQEGKVVNYDVEEVFVDKDGKILSWSDVKKGSKEYPNASEALSEYQNSYVQTAYHVGDKHDEDQQAITVTNSLQGSKDIHWHKQWRDDYTYTGGQRPDIYLNIYQVKHDGTTTLFQKDYKWTKNDETDKINYWTAELENVPKYDENGYEIFYYATEHTVVNAADFDYQDVQYAVDGSKGLEEIGTEFKPTDEATKDEDVVNVKDQEGAAKDHYALKEEGTFTNIIKNEITIKGQKVWSSLPNGYKELDLPAVTFYVMRDDKGDEPVATLKVEKDQWADLNQNGSYIFEILKEGNNYINKEGKIVNKDEEAPLLPKYDANGKLYQYELKEEVTFEPDNGWYQGAWENIFQGSSNTYRMSNAYKPPEGALKIKKFLYLPMGEDGKPEAYPAVQFKLTRTYTTNAGETSTAETVKTVTWSSAAVQDAYKKLSEEKQKEGLVEWTYSFENLDIYAPNGSPYIYTVEEVKTNLNGYDTWAGKGDLNVKECNVEGVKVEGLQPRTESEIQATFKNQQGKTEQVILKGNKEWNDYSNAFKFRPKNIELTVSRSADSQPDQDNGMDQDLNNTEYDINWTKSGDTWTYEIKGTGNDELEKYAPNGMPWKYQVKEADVPKYNVTPSNGTVSGSNDGKNTINMADLTNSIKTSEPFTKKWVDSDGKTITDDYLDTELAVTFKLQAADKPKEGEAADWQDAKAYFKTNLTDDAYKAAFANYSFETIKKGRINNADAWKTGYFSNLPGWIKDEGGNTHEVDYRVVEVSIQYGNSDPKATQDITVIEDDGTTYKYKYSTGIFEWGVDGSVEDTETTHINRLPTTKMTVKKVWKGDNNNLYNTRPDTGRGGYDWETTFVIQKSTDGNSWENVKVQAAGESAKKDLTVTLYGTNSDASVEATIEGLPETDLKGQDYTYRARELNTDQDQTVLKNEDTYNKTYTVTYDDPKFATDKKTTATNTLNSTKIYGEKQWNPGTLNAGKTTPVKLTAQYKTASGWKTVSSPVTVDGTPASAAVMDPTSSQYVPFHEYESWKAVWNDLPEVMPGSELKDGKTQYRVIETVPSGYVQEDAEIGKVGNYPSYIYKNVEAVSYSVEKVWGGTVKGKEIVVGLYRTTDEKDKGTGDSYKVKDSNGNQKTVTLTKDKSWKGSFSDLPKYSPSGALYIYYARELTIDGSPAGGVDYISGIYEHDENGKTKIVNVVKINITGTKTWKDNNNTYNTRPDTLTLTLYSQAEGSSGKVKVNATPKWTQNGSVWTYTYKDLPATDGDGKPYTYTVEESVPDPVSGDDKYTLSQSGNNLTNTLTDEISISGEKVWRDGNDADGKRPDSITVVLYKNGTEFKTKTIDSGDATADGTWKYTFSGLDEYDTEGKRITYTVDEVLPEGYSRTVNGNTITNTQLTSLDVEKVWGGVETDDQKEVVVGLYRTTGEKDETKDAVKGSDGKQITLALNSGNGWKGTFDDLAKYDVDGDGKEIEYTYYARELTIGGNPVKEADLYKVYDYDSENEQAATYATKIVNVGKTSITGSKTWVDNGNAYQNRPDKLELTLTRQIQGGETETVNVKPTWKDTDTDKWTYTYSDLPAADEKGNKYTYKVTETVPTPKDAATSGDEYADTQNGTDFTNTLTDKIDISGEKVWRDGGNADNKRPEKITVILYANDKEVKRQEITGSSTAGSWKYTFENLDEYDKDGKRITYTVDEVLPDGYSNKVTDLAITNT